MQLKNWRMTRAIGVTALVLALTGCLNINGDLKVGGSGESQLTMTIDSKKLQEAARQFNRDTSTHQGMTCADFLDDKADSAQWKCESLGEALIRVSRNYNAQETSSFLKLESGLIQSTYQFDPYAFLDTTSLLKKEGKSRETQIEELPKAKMLGMNVIIDLNLPGSIKTAAQLPLPKSGPLRMDMLDARLYADGGMIVSESYNLVALLLLLAGGVGVIGASLYLYRKSPAGSPMKQASLPVGGLLAVLILATPWWGTALAGKADTSSSAPSMPQAVPAPTAPPQAQAAAVPAVASTGALSSPIKRNWENYDNQHPSNLMESDEFGKGFQQLLGPDYEAVMNAVAVSSGAVLQAGYLIGDGMAPHSGGEDVAMWLIDTQDGKIYAAWRASNQIKVYGVTHESRLPAPLYTWYRAQGGAQ